MFNVLLYRSSPEGPADLSVRALIEYLQTSRRFELTISQQPPTLADLSRFEVLVLASNWLPEAEMAQALVTFVKRGGGLVCLGESADRWGTIPLLTANLGLPGHGYRPPTGELIVRVSATSDHPLTRRLYAGYAHDHYAGLDMDTAFPLTDNFFLSENVINSDNSQPLLLVSWQGARRPVAWVQALGEGGFFYTGLGAAASSWASPVFQQLVFRAINYVACARTGETAEKNPIRVAMLGYGAIGLEHGTAVTQVPGLEFGVVCDRNPSRLEEARRSFAGIKTFEDWQQIRDDRDTDLVIISTPPNSHASLALQMLEAGKHVVVEKPFCITTREADALIAAADKAQRTLTVYQCRRWDPDYLAIKAAVERGLIGEVFHMETFIGNFSHPCDYWHSDMAVSGGVFYDWGSHYLDWILGLMPGKVQSVSGFAHKRVWHDVTNEDQARVTMRFEDGREAEFMHSDIAAALKPKWYILGTKGAIVGQWRHEAVKTRRWSGDLIEERLSPSEALPVVTAYLRQEGGPIDEQKLALPPAPVFPFHRNLANHLLNGEPLAVTSQQARRNIVVMEAARRSAGEDGQFIKVEC